MYSYPARSGPAAQAALRYSGVVNLPDWIYRQSAVLPYKEGTDGIEVLLVTSRKGLKWILPKGTIEPGLTESQSAAQEGWEEAGIVGSVSAKSLGKYCYKKWGGICEVEVFPMEVSGDAHEWPESKVRCREWMSLDDAFERVNKKSLRRIIRRLPDVIDGNRGTKSGVTTGSEIRSATTNMGSRLIYLLRPAKSCRAKLQLKDRNRLLAPRGQSALNKIAGYMAFAEVQPQLILCSSVLRARQTLTGILPAIGNNVPVKFDRRIYTVGIRGLLNRLRQVPADVASVMLIAHNPALHALAQNLCKAGDESALKQIHMKLPTASLATLVLWNRNWAKLSAGTCELHSFIHPRQL